MKMKSKNNKLPETPTERNVGGPEDSWRGKTPPSVYPASDKESPISTSEMAVMGILGGGGGGVSDETESGKDGGISRRYVSVRALPQKHSQQECSFQTRAFCF